MAPPRERCKEEEPGGEISPEGPREPPPSRGWGGSSVCTESGGNTILRKKNVQNIHDMSSVVGKM